MTKDEALKQTLEAFEALIDKFSDVRAYEDEEYAFTDELIFIPDIKKAIKAIAAAKEALAQPEQEPVAWVSENVCNGQFINGRPRKIWWECSKGVGTAFYTTPPLPVQPEERNFCQRCGKRTADLTTIHTCTPPQIDPNQWAFDNGLEST